MEYMGWERASIGHESDLRRFARAYRALPYVEPKDFDGKVEVLNTASGAKYRKPEEPDVWVKWFGDRLAVLNDTGSRKYVSITVPKPLPKGRCLFDLAAGRILVQADKPMPSVETKMSLLEHDLHTLAIMPVAEAQKMAARAAPITVEQGHLRLKIEGDLYTGQEVTLRCSLVNTGKAPLVNAQVDVALPKIWGTVSGSNVQIPELPVLKSAPTIAPGRSLDLAIRLYIPHGKDRDAAWFTGTAVYTVGNREVSEQKSLAAIPEQSFGLTMSPKRVATEPDKALDFEIVLVNRIATPLEADLQFHLPQGWRLLCDSVRLSAGPKASAKLEFKVVVPDGTGSGEYKVGVSARPRDDFSAYAECDVRVTVP